MIKSQNISQSFIFHLEYIFTACLIYPETKATHIIEWFADVKIAFCLYLGKHHVCLRVSLWFSLSLSPLEPYSEGQNAYIYVYSEECQTYRAANHAWLARKRCDLYTCAIHE